MDTTAHRDATASEADVTLRRFAARGGVCGAVMVPAALLVLCRIVVADSAVDAMSLALVAGTVAVGVTLMLIARRAARPTSSARNVPERFPLRLVSDGDGDDPQKSRRSAA